MRLISAKLAFAHRTLWKRDETYRLASILGVPVLLGVGLAASVSLSRVAVAPWAKPEWSGNLPQDGTAIQEPPAASLPSPGPDGKPMGLVPGLQAAIQPLTVGAGWNIDVKPTRIASFTIDRPSLDMSRILAAGPADGLFVGTAFGLLAIPKAGRYGFSLRIARTISIQAANCLGRLGVGNHRALSQVELGLDGDQERSYAPVVFEMQPGLYRIGMAFGCWQGDHMAAPGQLTLLIRHPGESSLQPASSEEIWRAPPAGAR